MMMKGGLTRKSKVQAAIPDSSLSDMAFLLLIFFMVSTTFPREKPRQHIEIPKAKATEKSDEPRKDVLHIFVERDGRVFINDALIPMDQVSSVVYPLYVDSNQRLVTSLRADRDVPYSFVDAVQKELQEAGAVRVTFYTDLEERVTRRRR